jgi:hypothetical protein
MPSNQSLAVTVQQLVSRCRLGRVDGRQELTTVAMALDLKLVHIRGDQGVGLCLGRSWGSLQLVQ